VRALQIRHLLRVPLLLPDHPVPQPLQLVRRELQFHLSRVEFHLHRL
jgi:hypothetical protein